MSGGDFAIFILCAAIVIGCILLFDTIGKVWREIIEDEELVGKGEAAGEINAGGDSGTSANRLDTHTGHHGERGSTR